MAALPIFRISRRNCILSQIDPVLSFLAPSLQSSRSAPQTSVSRFSTSSPQWARDNNRNRGVSALRRTGPRRRQTLSVKKEDLPLPVLSPESKTKVEVDEDHGLWGFFNKERRLLATPEEDLAHGRAWTVQELRHKSWDDLHSLWWICVKERNRIATEKRERHRIRAGYGDFEADDRDQTVRTTQRAIRHVLTERWYAWEEARKVARHDEKVDLTGQGPAYTPLNIKDQFEVEELTEKDTGVGAESAEEVTQSQDRARPGRMGRNEPMVVSSASAA
ncbi:MRP-L47-domain-containing protein [Glonium stellatum]|uniref:Large ribosomal subunit protein uL29m n=1 Tax=Glonium stellatum TaxID=574774 RepID=A0A8E2JUT0_9PEZI|nr:MRP-L47-domain-containing protein [Glonium stellatum]